MPNKCCRIKNNKGVALFFVILLIVVESILVGVMLSIIRSNDRNTHHRISRIKALYAAQAAMVFTFQRLYAGNIASYSICPSNTLPGCAAAVIDPDISNKVDITVGPVNGCCGPYTNLRTITITTDYTSPL